MSNFHDLIEAARRLAILKALAGTEDYTLPEGEARDRLRVLLISGERSQSNSKAAP